MTPRETLLRGIGLLGLPAEDDTLRRFDLYLRELEKWNSLFGLVGADGRDLVVRHVLDSLAGTGPISAEHPRRLADIGSGAGFPGIPLAVYMPETSFTLVEPSRKRCAFLRSAAALMGRANVRVFEGELELVRDAFDIVTFRAFRPLDRRILRRLAAILAPGGKIAAYKGRREQIGEETAAAEALGFRSRIEEVSVPFLDEPRHLVWLSIPPTPGS